MNIAYTWAFLSSVKSKVPINGLDGVIERVQFSVTATDTDFVPAQGQTAPRGYTQSSVDLPTPGPEEFVPVDDLNRPGGRTTLLSWARDALKADGIAVYEQQALEKLMLQTDPPTEPFIPPPE